MLAVDQVRASGPADRPRRSRIDGAQEARGVFLMPPTVLDAAAESPASAGTAQKSLLRFLTCGSVDDGKSTLIGRLLYDSNSFCDDQLAAIARDSGRLRHAWRGDRSRAAGRWPRGRTRAGHHHRRRLPLFRDAAARLYCRRYAGPRTVYPQHGDRRVDRRSGGGADRRPQGRADPDPASQLHLRAAWHPLDRARRQQDRSGRVVRASLRSYRRGIPRLRQAAEF